MVGVESPLVLLLAGAGWVAGGVVAVSVCGLLSAAVLLSFCAGLAGLLLLPLLLLLAGEGLLLPPVPVLAVGAP